MIRAHKQPKNWHTCTSAQATTSYHHTQKRLSHQNQLCSCCKNSIIGGRQDKYAEPKKGKIPKHENQRENKR